MYRFLVMLGIFFSFNGHCNEALSATKKLALTCKVWGFLKYYHPKVARGYLDWDQVLIRSIAFTKSANNLEELNSFYAGGLLSLGKIDRCTTCAEVNPAWFLKNFDLSWTNDKRHFAPPVIDALNLIEHNRNQNPNYYALNYGAGNVGLKYEKVYDSLFVYPTEEYRLLALFRYWNIIEYYFPYKYQTDQHWDSVLHEMIPKFQQAEDTISYHLALMELTAKIDDSHGFYSNRYTYQYFGKLFMPFGVDIVENRLIVTSFFDDSLVAENPLKIGDVILKIDSTPVDTIIQQRYHFYAASNEAIKLREIARNILIGNDSLAELTIERNGKISEIQVKRYSPKVIEWKHAEDSTQWKRLKDDIGYVNMGVFKKGNEDAMMMDLMTCSAIIFDIRNYPELDVGEIMKYLHHDRVKHVIPTVPDYTYPGKFIWDYPILCGRSFFEDSLPKYNGLIVVLVNEQTQSAAEFSTMIFQTYENCITIGSQTSGADGNVSEVIFLHKFGAYFSGIGIFYPDSTETQRVGVKIDLEVKPTIKGIREGHDDVLEFAIDYITNEEAQK